MHFWITHKNWAMIDFFFWKYFSNAVADIRSIYLSSRKYRVYLDKNKKIRKRHPTLVKMLTQKLKKSVRKPT